jgi:hypothetical protein
LAFHQRAIVARVRHGANLAANASGAGDILAMGLALGTALTIVVIWLWELSRMSRCHAEEILAVMDRHFFFSARAVGVAVELLGCRWTRCCTTRYRPCTAAMGERWRGYTAAPPSRDHNDGRDDQWNLGGMATVPAIRNDELSNAGG